MKRILPLLAILLASYTLFAQSPEKFGYQAVIRDANNELVSNQQIGMRISVIQGSVNGIDVYVETQNPSSNDNGLISIQVGEGTVISGDLAMIDWNDGPYFIKTEIDPTGGSSYAITGSSQLISVPYAMHATTSDSALQESDPHFTMSVASGITSGDTANWNEENDPIFGGSIAAGITAGDTAYWNAKVDAEVDSSNTNELQTISKSGSMVTLSQGGGSFTDSVVTYTEGEGIDINANNEIAVDLSFILPAGMIIPFAGDTANIPAGWLLCDGSEVSRTTYANLFAAVDSVWGPGDGNSTFHLPDFRGRFLRGQAMEQTTDPDRNSRYALNGGNSGDMVGSYQSDVWQSHNHSVNDPGHSHYYLDRVNHGEHSDNANDRWVGSDSHYDIGRYTNSSTTGISINNSGGNETRPENAYVLYIIKI